MQVSIEPVPPARVPWQRVLHWSGLYLIGAAVLGALGAVFWVLVVDLPGYVVQADGHAVTTERDLTSVFSSDAWFACIGLVLGLGLGIIAWRWFRNLGWPMVALAAGAAVGAGLVCWFLGRLMGPGNFEERLAMAKPGDIVPVSLELRSPVVLALWVMMAVLPILLAASLARDPEDGLQPRRRRHAAAASPASAFSPMSAPSEPSAVAGAIPPQSRFQQPESGGGR